MKKVILYILSASLFYLLITGVALALIGCGNSDGNVTKAINELNQTISDKNTTVNIDNNTTVNIDNNVTVIDDSNTTVNVDNNVTVIINPLDTGYYGNGSFLEPFSMMKANYAVKSGDTWFMSPILNANCTIRVRTRVYITNILVEDSDFNPIHIDTISSNVFSFDLNNTRFATLNFQAHKDGYVTLTGACLDEPKYYNLGE